jgi:NAD(P)-dependent dehydrogenase (short-subunit alcohol dehydrogenase family)
LKKYFDDEKCGYAVCDLRDPKAIRITIKKAAEFLGGTVDVLVNNVSFALSRSQARFKAQTKHIQGGIAAPYWSNGKTFKDEETLDEWQAYVETNLTAPFVASQAVVPYMIKAVEADPELQKRGGAGPCSMFPTQPITTNHCLMSASCLLAC